MHSCLQEHIKARAEIDTDRENDKVNEKDMHAYTPEHT